MRPKLSMIALFLFAACGEVEGPAYRGAPLVSLRGQLSASPMLETSSDLHLAIAWYPHIGIDRALSQPRAIVAQDIVDPETFPLAYQFDLYGPPPPEALGDLSGVDGPPRAAVGVLLAYEDKNGNGALDTLSPGDSPKDRVLGASWEFFERSGFMVVYVDGLTVPQSRNATMAALRPGVNVVGKDGVAALDAEIPLHLDGDALLNLFVCEEVFATSEVSLEAPCGVGATTEFLHLNGEVLLTQGETRVSIEVYGNDAAPVSGATVTLGGHALSEAAAGVYGLTDSTGTLLSPGNSYELSASSGAGAGAAANAITVVVPGAFDVTSPSAGAVVPSGTFTVAWTPSSNAAFYRVRAGTPSGEVFFEDETQDTSYSLGPISHSGAARVTVRAHAQTAEESVTAIVERTVDISMTR